MTLCGQVGVKQTPSCTGAAQCSGLETQQLPVLGKESNSEVLCRVILTIGNIGLKNTNVKDVAYLSLQALPYLAAPRVKSK